MGTFNATQVNTGALRAAVDEFGADSVYFIHNHPSGNLKPSNQDRGMHSQLKGMFEGMKINFARLLSTRLRADIRNSTPSPMKKGKCQRL